jgi:hypothetical protein
VEGYEAIHEGARTAHELRRMSVFVGLIDVRDSLLPRPLQQGEYLVYIILYLFVEGVTIRSVVFPPALCPHDQQIEDGHDGDAVDADCLGHRNVGESENSRWDEDIDFDSTPRISRPTGEPAIEYAMCCPALSGWLEEIAIIRSFDYVFYIFRVKVLPKLFRDNNIDVLCFEYQPFSIKKGWINR